MRALLLELMLYLRREVVGRHSRRHATSSGRSEDQRPELVTTSLGWRPEGAASPSVLDVERYFSTMFDNR